MVCGGWQWWWRVAIVEDGGRGTWYLHSTGYLAKNNKEEEMAMKTERLINIRE